MEVVTPKRRKRNKYVYILEKVLAYSFLGILALMIIIPYLQLIMNSLKGPKEVEKNIFFPTEWYFSNYVDVFK